MSPEPVNLDPATNPDADAPVRPWRSTRPWHARDHDTAAYPPRQRLAIAALVVLAHALVLATWMQHTRQSPPPRVTADAIAVVLLAPSRPQADADIGPPPPARAQSRPARTPPPRARASNPARSSRMQVFEPAEADDAAAIDQPVQLYNADGSIAIPDDVLAELDAVLSDDREFSYQVPGIAKAKKFFQREVPVAYEATRFDEHWRPTDDDIVTSALATAVEKTTVSAEIPLAAGARLKCTVSVLAVVGGCGFVSYDDNYTVELNDPNTLDAEEARQCEAWWQQIVEATDQREWRDLRRRYDAECRKPLAATVKNAALTQRPAQDASATVADP